MQETLFINSYLQYKCMKEHGHLRGLSLFFAAELLVVPSLGLHVFETLYSPR